MDSTVDFESSDPSSNLGRTLTIELAIKEIIVEYFNNANTWFNLPEWNLSG